MITVFNRKRLFGSFSVKEQAQVRDLLARNKIPYVVKAANLTGGLGRAGIRARTGGVGLHMDYVYEYIIYVGKKDFKQAQILL